VDSDLKLQKQCVLGAAGGGDIPIKTRREYVRVGSVAASLLLTVLSGSSPLLPLQ